MTDNAVVTSAYFYTSPERPENCSLTYSSSGVNDVQTSSAAQASTNAMQNVATSPQLDSDSLLEVPEMLRPRSNSAPMILYQQVALELRGISDEFNREFMRDEVWTRPVIAHHRHTHPFNGPLSGTTRVSRYQKDKTNLDFTEARDSERQWHQLGHMQVCTLLQTDNHASTPPLSFLQVGCCS